MRNLGFWFSRPLIPPLIPMIPILLCIILGTVRAQNSQISSFTAKVTQNKVGLDESVNLKFSIQNSDGGRSQIGGLATKPSFQAPDFELINDYTSSTVESFYENGQFGMRNRQEITKVLKPLKVGKFLISGIQMNVGGIVQKVPDIEIEVTAAGAGTPPPPQYGGGGAPALKGSLKRTGGRGVFLKVEVDKSPIFKGQQVIVSYYLYRKARVFNINVEKFATLPGFLREDLEMPVISGRLDNEQVILDGLVYERSLLVRYAAYPLQEGKLTLDSMAMKYSYFVQGTGSLFEDDADPIFSLFPQMGKPSQGIAKNDPLSLEIMALPKEGRPSSFTGGVGEFSISSAVDKYEVRANEAINLVVKVEGKGNLAAIGEPKGSWPNSIEIYDSKSTVKSGRGGVGQKIFEFLLLPRTPGAFTLPKLEISFFNPETQQYTVQGTEEFQIQVSEPAGGITSVSPRRPILTENAISQPTPPGQQISSDDLKIEDLQHIRPENPRGFSFQTVLARAGFFFGIVVFIFALVIVIWVIWDQLTQRYHEAKAKKKKSNNKIFQKKWQELRGRADRISQTTEWSELIAIYQLLGEIILLQVEKAFQTEIRSLPRSEVEKKLSDHHGFHPTLWERVNKLFDFVEFVQFGAAAGGITKESASHQLEKWIDEGATITKNLPL